MAVSTNKRSTMTLYSSATDPYSYRVRIVLAEKGVTFDFIDVHSSAKTMEELMEINPYGTVPTLVDRDLVLYQSEIIMEYLDERFPHPPLLPVYPVAKGRSRLMIYRVNHDWYTILDKLLQPENYLGEIEMLKKKLVDSITSVTPIFAELPYFLSEDFSLVDCCIAPLLWRLPKLAIELPSQAAPILRYAERVFSRESFQASLVDGEKVSKVY
jgi:RNA polymerase-associated protein